MRGSTSSPRTVSWLCAVLVLAACSWRLLSAAVLASLGFNWSIEVRSTASCSKLPLGLAGA